MEPDPHRFRALAPRPPEGDLNLDRLAGGDGPLEIDIGFGRGMSLFERARVSPASRLLGIEVKTKLGTLVADRAKRHNLEQITVWVGDAREILSRSGPDGSVARVFVHFPDPWWKKRHGKRRVVAEETLGEIARLLAPGGDLFIQTDVEDRALDYRDLVRDHGAYSLQGADGWVSENPFGALSNRERRASRDGLPIHRIHAIRR